MTNTPAPCSRLGINLRRGPRSVRGPQKCIPPPLKTVENPPAYPDRMCNGGNIVCTVARHCHNFILSLRRVHQPQLLVRYRSCENAHHVSRPWRQILCRSSNHLRTRYRLGVRAQTNPPGDADRRTWVVARNNHHANPRFAALGTADGTVSRIGSAQPKQAKEAKKQPCLSALNDSSYLRGRTRRYEFKEAAEPNRTF